MVISGEVWPSNFISSGKANTGSKHFRGIGVAKLVRDDAGGKAERVADLMQVITELTNECFFAARTGQEPSIGRQRIKGTKESEALDEFTHKGIHGDHTFCFEFAEWHVNRPLIRAGGAQAVEGQIGTLTDAHAGVANQQKDVATQIVAAEELLLQEFILLCRERTWKSLREARNVLAADQMSEFRKLFGPSQLVEDAAQSDEQVDIGRGREWRRFASAGGTSSRGCGVHGAIGPGASPPDDQRRDSSGNCGPSRGSDESFRD